MLFPTPHHLEGFSYRYVHHAHPQIRPDPEPATQPLSRRIDRRTRHYPGSRARFTIRPCRRETREPRSSSCRVALRTRVGDPRGSMDRSRTNAAWARGRHAPPPEPKGLTPCWRHRFSHCRGSSGRCSESRGLWTDWIPPGAANPSVDEEGASHDRATQLPDKAVETYVHASDRQQHDRCTLR